MNALRDTVISLVYLAGIPTLAWGVSAAFDKVGESAANLFWKDDNDSTDH